jgi:hypothetical protein
MTLGQFFLLYLLAGSAVAAAVYLTFAAPSRGERAFQVATALLFWPFYLTLLLSRGRTADATSQPDPALPPDALGRAIAQVDAELDAALQGLGGWADSALERERDRLHALRAAWTAQAERVREMDRLLAQLEWSAEEPLDGPASERVQASRSAIRQNLRILRQVRERAHQNLIETLAAVREVVSAIHLAKFTDAPPARAEELIAQIAAAVHGLSRVSCQTDSCGAGVGDIYSPTQPGRGIEP